MAAIIWIGIALVCGAIGKSRECGWLYGFGWGMLCPPIGLIYVLISKRKKTQMEAFQELEFLKSKNLVANYIYEKMKQDITGGKIRPLDWYLNDGEKRKR